MMSTITFEHILRYREWDFCQIQLIIWIRIFKHSFYSSIFKKLARIEEQSQKLGITGNQLVLAWMLTHHPKIIPILGFSRLDHYLEDIKAYTINLPEEVLAILNKEEPSHLYTTTC